MEYLQYIGLIKGEWFKWLSFKPCYKWNTFNTNQKVEEFTLQILVLNLVINGIPSILMKHFIVAIEDYVLNLVINGIPSIHSLEYNLS